MGFMSANIQIDKQRLSEFCRRHHIVTLSFFGSVLRADFNPGSDIDVLVDFEAGHLPGLLGIAQMERELSTLLNDRVVDLRTYHDLSRYFRNEVLASAELQYAQG